MLQSEVMIPVAAKPSLRDEWMTPFAGQEPPANKLDLHTWADKDRQIEIPRMSRSESHSNYERSIAEPTQLRTRVTEVISEKGSTSGIYPDAAKKIENPKVIARWTTLQNKTIGSVPL